MSDIKQKIETILKSAKNHADTDRMVRTIEVGQWIRQGDINVLRVDDATQTSRGKKTSERQLAPGTTKGSRHIVEGDVEIFAPIDNDPLQGPTIKAKQRFTVTHPEHSNVSLPAGTYAVTYQRDFAQEERARVAD